MTCTPLAVTPGLFINTQTWSQAPNASSGAVTVTRNANGITVAGPGGTVFHQTLPGRVLSYRLFGTPPTVVILDSDTGAGNRSLTLIDFTGATPVERLLFTVAVLNGSVPSPGVHPSQGNGGVFLAFAATGMDVAGIAIYRSSNGAVLCSAVPFTPTVQIAGEATTTELRIKDGGMVVASCPLPQGQLAVTPPSVTFPNVPVGAGCPQPPVDRSFTLRNTGTDCLQITAIGNVGPFSVVGTVPPLPASLAPNETLTATVRFAPAAVGATGNVALPITRLPARGADRLTCSGAGVAAVSRLVPDRTVLAFGAVPVGTNSPPILVRLRNTGQNPLNVTVAGPPPGSNFQWTGFNGTIPCNDQATISVTFIPPTEGAFQATLPVTSAPASTPPIPTIALQGSGCVANAAIVVSPTPFPAFGDVQRGFRTARFITVRNTGDGPLTFTARIANSAVGTADLPLFGLQPPSGSITDIQQQRTYVVNPIAPCGALAAGTGMVEVAVAFFANAAPGQATAELIIDGHNGTGAGPARWTFLLVAEIRPPVAVDAAVVLDRSGSMADPLGSRNKSEAALSAGRLLVELLRPDLDDRATAVSFDDVPAVVFAMTAITAANQGALVGQIGTANFAPRNSTSIAAGVMTALPEFAAPRAVPPPQLTKALIVLTDGQDNTPFQNPADGQWYSAQGGPIGGRQTQAVTVPAGIKAYAVGLGRDQDVNAAALDRLATATGGAFRVVGDLVGPTYFNLEKHFTEIYMDIANTASILDPRYTIGAGQTQRIEFDVLRGDVQALVVIFDYQGRRLPFQLVSPQGEVIDVQLVPPGYRLRSGATNTARFVEVLLPPDEPKRYAGRWAVEVHHPGEVCFGSVDPQSAKRGFVPRECRPTKDPVDYGIAIGVGSNFRMQPFVTPAPVNVGEPILLSAVVTEAGLPVTGCAVTVAAESPSGQTWSLTLLDDGAHDDGDPEDAEYAQRFTKTAEAGTYAFTFRAEGLSRDGELVAREATLAKYVAGRDKPPHGEDEFRRTLLTALERQGNLLERLLDSR